MSAAAGGRIVEAAKPRGPEPEERVARPAMYQSWNRLTFLHWRYDPAVIRPLVPSPLALETFDGDAWIGVTPFLLEGLRAPFVPTLPWLSRSPETNVRTYVVGPNGLPGIWFFSLDIARFPAFAFARTVYRLPYMWSSLELRQSATTVRYTGRRRLPERNAHYDITVEPGQPFEAPELGSLDHFLTARWRLFVTYGSTVATTAVEHPPWPLHRTTVRDIDQSLLGAAGIPEPGKGMQPLVHFSPGVDTRIGPPRVVKVGDR
ncbi:MAG: YqjF family protein [Actinomycetota bacterium]